MVANVSTLKEISNKINQEVLNKTIFPLSELTKKEVRDIAKSMNLSTFEKKDSTGICFIGERPFPSFLENYIKDSIK